MTSRATKIDTKEGDLSDLEVGGLNLEADDAAPKGVGTVKAVAACLLYMFIGECTTSAPNSGHDGPQLACRLPVCVAARRGVSGTSRAKARRGV